MTNKPKIALACQGGGSQTAFTAGVLKAIFDGGIHHEREIIALTGTSGGAVNAALAWYGLLKAAKGDTMPISKRIADFWEDLAAKHPLEAFLDYTATDALRRVSEGIWPTFEISPSSPVSHWIQSAISAVLPRERFMNFKGLLEDHINFDEIPGLLQPTSPILLIGAANVTKGNLKIFNSRKGEFCVEALLASAAIPNIFPAVQIGKDYYWDGLFSANPPVDELIQPRMMGYGNFPETIWVILINPITCKTVPTKPNEIVDRRNQMIGNVSLLQDLETLAMLGRLFKGQGFSEKFFKETGWTNPEWVKVRFIQMSEEVQSSLDYPSKLSRSNEQIHKLIEHGEERAKEIIARLREPAYTIEEATRILSGESDESLPEVIHDANIKV